MKAAVYRDYVQKYWSLVVHGIVWGMKSVKITLSRIFPHRKHSNWLMRKCISPRQQVPGGHPGLPRASAAPEPAPPENNTQVHHTQYEWLLKTTNRVMSDERPFKQSVSIHGCKINQTTDDDPPPPMSYFWRPGNSIFQMVEHNAETASGVMFSTSKKNNVYLDETALKLIR